MELVLPASPDTGDLSENDSKPSTGSSMSKDDKGEVESNPNQVNIDPAAVVEVNPNQVNIDPAEVEFNLN